MSYYGHTKKSLLQLIVKSFQSEGTAVIAKALELMFRLDSKHLRVIYSSLTRALLLDITHMCCADSAVITAASRRV